MSNLEEELALQLRMVKLPFTREFRFDSIRKYRFDFADPTHKLAVEVEGGHWIGGRHVRGSGFEGDCDKYNLAAVQGWRVLRFTARHIKSGSALATIEAALK